MSGRSIDKIKTISYILFIYRYIIFLSLIFIYTIYNNNCTRLRISRRLVGLNLFVPIFLDFFWFLNSDFPRFYITILFSRFKFGHNHLAAQCYQLSFKFSLLCAHRDEITVCDFNRIPTLSLTRSLPCINPLLSSDLNPSAVLNISSSSFILKS